MNITLEIKKIANDLIDLFDKHMSAWDYGTYIIIAKSGESVSYSAGPHLFNSNDVKLPNENYLAFIPDNEFNDWIIKHLREVNKVQKANVLTFIFKNKEFISLENSWDQTAHEESIQYYSKAKLAKLKAWYLPDDGITTTPARMEILPKKGVKMDVTELTLDKAFQELNKAVIYQDDPLWDGGFYSITYNEEGWSGEAHLYLYDSLESKERKLGADEVNHSLAITDEMKKLFLFIQDTYKTQNPSTPYDSLFVTVQSDGVSYVTNFELEGEEVYPAAPPTPEVLDAAYLCENLQNCLAYNAPDNYKWVWEVLKKSQTEDGKTQLEGNFFYSLNEDKSAPQQIEPGEYMYMYNVSERLFDEFLPDTEGWSEIALYFSKNRNVSYSVINK